MLDEFVHAAGSHDDVMNPIDPRSSRRNVQPQPATETAPSSKHDFSHLSLSHLEQTKIDFGQTHHGKTYREMWANQQEWVLCFTGRNEKSELMIERAELEGSTLPVHKGESVKATPIRLRPNPCPRRQ